MHKYNTTFPEDATAQTLEKFRLDVLGEIMGKVGKGSFIEPPLNVDYGCNIIVGENFYSNFKYGLNLPLLQHALR